MILQIMKMSIVCEIVRIVNQLMLFRKIESLPCTSRKRYVVKFE
jgi:hypothetical protein